MTTYPFKRPVFIVAAPRSGSTLLFEQLSKSQDFWTIGGESHTVIESIEDFNVDKGKCDSNHLTSLDATDKNIQELKAGFYELLRNNKGVKYNSENFEGLPRFLEKTPKNALRISLLNKAFPDALFIYLYRNPRENISSMIDAWQSKRFQTYVNLPGRTAPWSLLLPKYWQNYHQKSLQETVTFQWNSANQAILDELSKLERHRWTSIGYSQLIKSPKEELIRLCQFSGVSSVGIIESDELLTASRYTLTSPKKNKWHKNAQSLVNVIDDTKDTIEKLKLMIPDCHIDDIDCEIDMGVINVNESDKNTTTVNISRNAKCHCGSDRRYKHCHGKSI